MIYYFPVLLIVTHFSFHRNSFSSLLLKRNHIFAFLALIFPQNFLSILPPIPQGQLSNPSSFLGRDLLSTPLNSLIIMATLSNPLQSSGSLFFPIHSSGTPFQPIHSPRNHFLLPLRDPLLLALPSSRSPFLLLFLPHALTTPHSFPMPTLC